MSRDLSPAELHICRMVSAFLAITVLAFLVFNVIDSLFNSSPPVRMVQIRPDFTNSTGRKPQQPSQSSPLIVQKEPAGGVVPEQPARVSPSQMQAGLQQLRALALEKTIRFDPQPLQPRLDANSPVPADAVSKPASTEISQPQWKGKVITANASTEPPSIEPSQETKLQPEPHLPLQREPKQASLGAESFTYEQTLQIKSRLRDLSYLSATKSGGWDAGTRDALRDFKLMNHLPNDDVWDLETSKKLNSQTAIRADQSIIGSWSTAPCRSAKTTNIRLSINSRRAKSSAGSVCEFRDVQWNNREWRVRANCSQGTQHWVANGKFALMANKLVWTSERDVISYFRCN